MTDCANGAQRLYSEGFQADISTIAFNLTEKTGDELTAAGGIVLDCVCNLKARKRYLDGLWHEPPCYDLELMCKWATETPAMRGLPTATIGSSWV